MITHLTIVTGSSRGLGAALVDRLIGRGHRVLGIARHTNPALQARADAAGALLEQWPLDLADAPAAARRLQHWLQAIDDASVQRLTTATLVNNAGALGMPAALHQVPVDTLSAALRVGLEAPLLLGAVFIAATEGWSARRRMMNISSGLGRRAMAGSAAYCAAKAGMDHFSRAVALEQAGRPDGVRIVSIAPGVIDTDMQAELRGADPQRFPEREAFVRLQADGQLMTADDCAARLLARLDRADFGSEAVADIREG